MAPAKKLKPVPKFKSDAEAERFVETADLSEYDVFANASPVTNGSPNLRRCMSTRPMQSGWPPGARRRRRRLRQ